MNILLLPGNSPRHARWVEAFKSALAPQFPQVRAQHYQHWDTNGAAADVPYELSIAKQQASDLRPYTIIAKSIGTIITAQGVATGELTPEKIILLGIPLQGSVDPVQFNEWLRAIKIPVIIVQNTADPMGTFANIKTAFGDADRYTSFIETPGSTHDYLDFATIARLV